MNYIYYIIISLFCLYIINWFLWYVFSIIFTKMKSRICLYEDDLYYIEYKHPVHFWLWSRYLTIDYSGDLVNKQITRGYSNLEEAEKTEINNYKLFRNKTKSNKRVKVIKNNKINTLSEISKLINSNNFSEEDIVKLKELTKNF